MNDAWKILDQMEYDQVWDSFYDEFNFQPSIDREKFPSILEPNPSTTYAISHNFGDDNKVKDLNDKVLEALGSQTSEDERIYVLNWQHECYWLYPHRNFRDWRIPVLPNGDYYIFLAKDLSFGIFGHPWEWTSCVWGEGLISFLEKSRPELWTNVVRRKS